MLAEERLARLKLVAALPRRPDGVWALLEAFGSAAKVLAAGPKGLADSGLLSFEEAERLLADASAFAAERELSELTKLGGVVLFRGEPGFPDGAVSIADPPAALYLWGRLEERPALAVVGTRMPSPYGLRMASRLSADAVRAGLAVVSGMARGIDTAAHAAAMEAGGPTWAVLGSGFLKPYPAENRGLMRRIVEAGGAVISEHSLWTEPARENFPRRNRIISALSFGTVVVEGALKSGALNTARAALDQGREVFAVPGPAESELSRGPHALLRQGAKLVESIEDVIEELNLWSLGLPRAAVSRPAEPVLAKGERTLLDALGPQAKSFDDLAQAVGMDAAQVSEALLDLELKGLVLAMPGKRFARK